MPQSSNRVIDQLYLCELINKFRKNTLTVKEFKTLKLIIARRVKVRKNNREDVVAITIEKIYYSKVLFNEFNVNLFIRQRIIDACYKAGITSANSEKVPNAYKIKTIAYSDLMDDYCSTMTKIPYYKDEKDGKTTYSLLDVNLQQEKWVSDYKKAEDNANLCLAFKLGRSGVKPEFKEGGGLFDTISQVKEIPVYSEPVPAVAKPVLFKSQSTKKVKIQNSQYLFL
jgi:hypothetical protein